MLVIMDSLLAYSGLSVLSKVRVQGVSVSLLNRNGNPQVFKILIERFPAEIDFARSEKASDVSLKFRGGEADDAAAHAA